MSENLDLILKMTDDQLLALIYRRPNSKESGVAMEILNQRDRQARWAYERRLFLLTMMLVLTGIMQIGLTLWGAYEDQKKSEEPQTYTESEVQTE